MMMFYYLLFLVSIFGVGFIMGYAIGEYRNIKWAETKLNELFDIIEKLKLHNNCLRRDMQRMWEDLKKTQHKEKASHEKEPSHSHS